jgi:hypothetical protein
MYKHDVTGMCEEILATSSTYQNKKKLLYKHVSGSIKFVTCS